MNFENEFPKRSGDSEVPEGNSLREGTLEERMLRVLQAGQGWRCEESLHKILNAWAEEMGPAYVPRSKRLLKQLIAGARAIRDEVGESNGPAFVRYATAEMKQAHLTIADIWSLGWLFGKFMETLPEHDEWQRRRYLHGSLADDDD